MNECKYVINLQLELTLEIVVIYEWKYVINLQLELTLEIFVSLLI